MLIVPVVVIVELVTVNVLLDTPTLVTVPPEVAAATVILPVDPLNTMPVPAFNLVTPVLVITISLALVTGLPDTCNPVPETNKPTLVTVPATVLLEILVILPSAPTVTVGFVYVAAVTPVFDKFIDILPLLVIGLPVTTIELLSGVKPTLVTVPPPPFPPPVELIVILPVFPDKTIPVPPFK